MRTAKIIIWRNPDTKEWFHRFVSSNGRDELARQSEGVVARRTAIRSAERAYGVTITEADGRWWVVGRVDVGHVEVITS